MFDRLFSRASTVARHITAPYAEERARYLQYCERRGDSRSTVLCKAHDLLWISRKLSDRDLPITIDQVRGLVVSGRDQHLAMKEKALALCDLPSYAGTRPWRSAPKLIEFLKAL